MLRNYLTIAYRQLLRHKGYSLINILGLAVGIACCLIILLYVRDEQSFDTFHEKGDRVYRVGLHRHYPERVRSYAVVPHSYDQALKTEFPEVEETVRLQAQPGNTVTLKYEDETFEVADPMFVDSTFFRVFGFELLRGQPDEVLREPNTVVLTESVARRIFGNEDPVGKTLEMPGNDQRQIVTGVMADAPANSHLKFSLLASSSGFDFLDQPNFVGFSCYLYLLLKPGSSPEGLQAKFPEMVRKYASGQIRRNFGYEYEDYLKAGNGYDYFLQPLPDIYLHSNLEAEIRPPGSLTRVRVFTIIAIFILLIAVINFMNLATARSTERAREVGIRKTVGSLRSQVALQFMTEAVLISVLSTALALVVVGLLLPLFNNLAGKDFSIRQVVNLGNVPVLLIFALIVGLLSGSYPAAVLSRFRPVAVLKGKLANTGHGLLLRNGLVVFQFTISVLLIISTIVVYSQMNFIRNKELGFNEEQVLKIQTAFALQTQTEAFKEELLKMPEVVSVGGCNSMPGETFAGTSFRKDGDSETVFGSRIYVDENFVECLQMEMAAGRDFGKEYSDSMSVILNETAVQELGLEDPLGKRLATTDDIRGFGGADGDSLTFFNIVGVVKDFHFQSLHQVISPVFFVLNPNPQGASNIIPVRISPGNYTQTVSRIEALWSRFLPNQPFHYSFLDADLETLYASEQIAQQVFGLFSLLAIFIACMGLLGLAAFIIRQRTKEIGVRKVLGASTGQIISLLSRDFLRLVLIALVVAIPTGWFFMHRWLQDFAYSINLSWWIFALAGALAIAIAFLTVSYQSIRAALMNPVESLRDE